jgi:hypothetical protein
VHRTYAPLLLPIIATGVVKALCHITGGGYPDNLPRVLPEGIRAEVDTSAWEPPPIFRLIRDSGELVEYGDDRCGRQVGMRRNAVGRNLTEVADRFQHDNLGDRQTCGACHLFRAAVDRMDNSPDCLQYRIEVDSDITAQFLSAFARTFVSHARCVRQYRFSRSMDGRAAL